MKNIWPASFGLSAILAAIVLAGCGSPARPYTNGPPATIAYMFSNTGITGYSIVAPNIGSAVGTLTLAPAPSTWVTGFTTDSTGQIYVTVSATDGTTGQILIYPPNSTGAATPSRTIDLNFVPSELTVDPTGRVYVLDLPKNWSSVAPGGTVAVYSATASGMATPLRSLQLPSVSSYLAADRSGNIYMLGGADDNGTFTAAIDVYPSTANGVSTPDRTISIPVNFNVWGVAVDPAGDIFVDLQLASGPPYTNFFIEEFAPGAKGAANPVRTIKLPIGSAWENATAGPLRLDGAGNIFTSLELYTLNGPLPSEVLYEFAPTASGAATPTVELTPEFNDAFGLN